jgi:hypothetical protein
MNVPFGSPDTEPEYIRAARDACARMTDAQRAAFANELVLGLVDPSASLQLQCLISSAQVTHRDMTATRMAQQARAS